MFTLTALGEEISPDIVRQMDVLEELGIKFLEFRGAKDRSVTSLRKNQLQAIKKRLDERGFRVSVVASPLGKTRIDEDFGHQLDELKKVQDVAEMFGTRHVRVFSFYPDQTGNLLNRREEVMERFGALVERARERNQVLLVENAKRVYGESPARCLDILQTINSPHLRAAFDFGNFVEVGVRPFEDAYPVLRDYIDYVQVKDAQRQPDGTCRLVVAGQGDGQVALVLAELAKLDREIFLSVVPGGTVPSVRVPGRTEPCTCRETVRALTSILEQIETRTAAVTQPLP